jgi:hypothetical protein
VDPPGSACGVIAEASLDVGCTAARRRVSARTVVGMLALIVILLIVWAVLAILGFVIKGLIWLAIAGLILFVITAIIGFIRRNASSKS